MDKSISDRNLDLPEFGQPIGGLEGASDTEAPDIISILAVESLSTGSKTPVNKELNKSQVKISELGDVEDIERLMQESLLDAEISDDDTQADFPEFIFEFDPEGEQPSNEINDFPFYIEGVSSEEEEAMDKDIADLAFVLDKDAEEVIAGALDAEYFKRNFEKTGGFLVNKKNLELGGPDAEMIAKLIREGKIRYVGEVSEDIKNIIDDNTFEIKTFSEEQWDNRIKAVYLATLGIRVEIIRNKTLDVSEKEYSRISKNVDRFNIEKNIVQIDSKKFNNLGMIRSFVNPLIFVKGEFHANLSKLEKVLSQRKEDLKEKERQNRKSEILTREIQGRELLHQLMNSELKKEKIWFENATSFLRYLLKKDRKILILSKLN